MQFIDDPEVMADWAKERRRESGTVALVPTMGALHAGHLALIKLAQMHADEVVVSLFVNPTQFGEAEDFTKYPRRLKQDLMQCEELGVDVLFAPSSARGYVSPLEMICIGILCLGCSLSGRDRTILESGK